MSAKTIVAVTAAIMLGSTALASAQTRVAPRYWGDYYGPGTPDYPPITPGGGAGYYGRGYYDYSPGYYDRTQGPYFNPGPYYSPWNSWTNEHGWNRWNVDDD